MAADTRVFISYASDTKPLAEELMHALESHGVEAWVDFKNLRPGQRWREELERAIDSAQWVVILVSSESRATPWQEAEWSAVLAGTWADTEKNLLPVVFGKSEPPPFLRNWVSLRVDPETDAPTWTGSVLDTLRRVRNEAVHGAGPQNRAERRQRLDELRKAAESLRQAQPENPTTQPE